MPDIDFNMAGAKVAEDMVAFAQKLIQTPSLSGEEKDTADLIVSEMQRLAFDEVLIDKMGNVIGLIKGTGQGENVLFNCHMDTVDAGRLETWTFSPYQGIIEQGYLYGRGASDMKGAIASQIYGVSLIQKMGLSHKGDIVVGCVVQEEPAECVGTAYLCDITLDQLGIKPHFVVLGEPSSLKVILGHKGAIKLEVTTLGRISHGSSPQNGVNAVYKMLPIIHQLQELDASLPESDLMGKSTVNLTAISCSPAVTNIIPDRCTAIIDARLIPELSSQDLLNRIREIIEEIKVHDPECQGSVKIREVEEISYTGMKTRVQQNMAAWLIPSDHPKVIRACSALRKSGLEPEHGYWNFATDGSYTSAVLNIPTIGFGPGEERFAHTPDERVGIDALVRSMIGNASIAREITR